MPDSVQTALAAVTNVLFLLGGLYVYLALVRQISSRVPVEAWAPTEKVVIEAREVNAGLLQTRAAQLAVALGLALRKEKESRS